MLLGVNDDDDDRDGIVDSEDGEDKDGNEGTSDDLNESENDLAEVRLTTALSSSVTTGTIVLEATNGGGSIAVWSSAQKGKDNKLFGPEEPRKTWVLGTDIPDPTALPPSVYVEAISPSSSDADITLQLRYESPENSYSDDIKLTAARVNLDVKRLDGTLVGPSAEQLTGSITKILHPADDSTSSWQLSLPNFALAPASLSDDLTFTLEKVAPSSSQGLFRVFRNSELFLDVQGASQSVLVTYFTDNSTFSIQATGGGVVDLALVAKQGQREIHRDTVRISAIPSVPGSGNILFVNPSAPQPMPPFADFETSASTSVQAALDFAAENDNVLIARAHLVEANVTPLSPVVIAGLGGQYLFEPPAGTSTDFVFDNVPTIDGSGQGPIFELSYLPGKTVITGLKIINGSAPSGGGVNVIDCEQVLLDSCLFDSNYAWDEDSGGGVKVRVTVSDHPVGSSFIIRNNVYVNNKCPVGKGGGAAFVGPHDAPNLKTALQTFAENFWAENPTVPRACKNYLIKITRTHFLDCRAWFGGAVSVGRAPRGGAYSEITHNTFENNKASGPGGIARGGAIFLSGPMTSGTKIDQNEFHGNEAADGGAIALYTFANAVISGNLFKDNKAREDGGALYVTVAASALVMNNTFDHNQTVTANADNGGAVQVGCNSIARFINNTFKNNSSGGRGGAVNARNSRIHFEGAEENKNEFSDNTSVKEGGAVSGYAANVEDYDQGSETPTMVIVKNALIATGNRTTAHGGGAIGCKRHTDVGVTKQVYKIDVLSCTINANKADLVRPNVGTEVIGGIYYRDIGDVAFNRNAGFRAKLIQRGTAMGGLTKAELADLFIAAYLFGYDDAQMIKDNLRSTTLSNNQGYQYAIEVAIPPDSFVEDSNTINPNVTYRP